MMRFDSRLELIREKYFTLTPASEKPLFEDAGGGFCKINLDSASCSEYLLALVCRMTFLSPFDLEHITVPSNCRLFFPLFVFCHRAEKPLFLRIDGRCASGKTTLAELLSRLFACTVLHVDDFFLPAGRTPEDDLGIPGGNIEYSRLLNDVLLPLSRGTAVEYTSYRCSTGTYVPAQFLSPSPITVLEGAYALHPALGDDYDLSVFLTVSEEVRRQRILARSPNHDDFFTHWIPMEEHYFAATKIMEHCNFIFDTSDEQ